MKYETFPGKLLLFGEYSIIKGGRALAMPLSTYSGYWEQRKDGQAYQQGLPALLRYLQALAGNGELKSALDLKALESDLAAGWYFSSTIPGGFGAGSSGALCAAVFDRYRLQTSAEDDLMQLREQLAQIESYFHGASSGVDPLICYLRKNLLIHENKSIEKITLPKPEGGQQRIFLINTGLPRKTEPLVHIFLEKCKQASFHSNALIPLLNYNEQAIRHLRAGQWPLLLEAVKNISQLQFNHFQEMIPEQFMGIWKMGLEDGGPFHLKLCGAGGGGFILGFCRDWEKAQQDLGSFDLEEVVF